MKARLRRPLVGNDVLYEIALDLGLDPDCELFAGPVDADEVFAALPALEPWRGFIESHYGLADIEQPTSAPDGDVIKDCPDAPSLVEIDYGPTDRGSEQVSLDGTNNCLSPIPMNGNRTLK